MDQYIPGESRRKHEENQYDGILCANKSKGQSKQLRKISRSGLWIVRNKEGHSDKSTAVFRHGISYVLVIARDAVLFGIKVLRVL